MVMIISDHSIKIELIIEGLHQGCMSRTSVGPPAIKPPPPQAKIQQSNPSPPLAKKIPFYLVLKGSNIFSAPSAPKNNPKPYIFVFYCVFMHYWTNCRPFWHNIEQPDTEILILNVRTKI